VISKILHCGLVLGIAVGVTMRWARSPEPDSHAAVAVTVMDDLRQHADYLGQFAKARVPVLWRPLHEIEGGWFWWSDTKTPENTAKLWRMMFDNHEGH